MTTINRIMSKVKYKFLRRLSHLLLLACLIAIAAVAVQPVLGNRADAFANKPLAETISSNVAVSSGEKVDSTLLLAQLPLPDYLLIGAVTSEPRPQRKQTNRSSGNFSVQAPANRIYWQVFEGNFQSPNVRFNIMWDRSGRTDPVLARGLRNGSITSGNEVFFQRSIYIANPSGAGGNFQVRAYRYGQ